MKDTIKVVIMDTDRYLVQGLEYALQEYFNSRGMQVDFFNGMQAGISVDIVFFALKESGERGYCDFPQYYPGLRPLYISLRKSARVTTPQENVCIREVGVLDNHANINTLFNLLDEKLIRVLFANASPVPCYFCLGKKFTRREKEVISYLRLGVNQTQTAKYMNLSVKTVNTYKNSVMRKLNFRKKNDLLVWLLEI